MELKKQVCSLELAKRLKELGVKQDAYFGWKQGATASKENPEGWKLTITYDNGVNGEGFAAFTVAELGEMLPFDPRDDQDDIVPHVNDNKKRHGKWTITYYAEGAYHEMAPSEADARAKMLVYLLENGLLK